MLMTPGLIAFFVVLAVLSAAYAILAPTHTNNTGGAGKLDGTFGEPAEEKVESLFDKLVRPAIVNILPQTPKSLTDYARKNQGIRVLLAKTGNPWRVTPEEYVVVRLLAVVAGMMVMLFLTVVGYAPIPLMYSLPFGAFLGYIAPKSILDSAWAKRRRELSERLPEALDLLRICMNAGYNFQNALNQTVELLPQGETRTELSRVVAELRAGRTIVQALDGFARRCPTDGVEAFTRAINQAQATGVDIATTLSYQSEESRADYERAIEVKAQKLQSTLFLPLIGFFLPTLLIIIFGPAFVTLMGAL